ncbi:hypothetical protein [Lysinibacillus sp. RC79]|uniref:hypothetical protein n=1 Tax=Lysinibacillus sp. RC79 TaxID=3156296 RepID=UPI0035140977
MNKLIISLTFFIIAAMIYSATLIATGLYTISLPELFNIRLLEIGKIPITISILALCIGFGFGILHLRENK